MQAACRRSCRLPCSTPASRTSPASITTGWAARTTSPPTARLAERFIKADPELIAGVRANRAFLGRAVRLPGGRGAASGSSLTSAPACPTADNTHEVAQRVAPDSRVVYVDNDPIVLAHARALLTSDPEGPPTTSTPTCVTPATILAQAARTLDFARPVAVMLLGILQFIPDEDDPRGIVAG